MNVFFSIIRILCNVITVLILLRVIASWYAGPTNVVFRALHLLTNPVLSPIRRIVPRVGRLDFSPMVAIIILQIIYYLLL